MGQAGLELIADLSAPASCYILSVLCCAGDWAQGSPLIGKWPLRHTTSLLPLETEGPARNKQSICPHVGHTIKQSKSSQYRSYSINIQFIKWDELNASALGRLWSPVCMASVQVCTQPLTSTGRTHPLDDSPRSSYPKLQDHGNLFFFPIPWRKS